MTDKIKVAQIGVTHEHAQGKMTTLRLLDDIFEICGVVDDMQTAKTPKFPSDQHPFDGIRRLEENELFRLPGLQGVMVEVPNNELVDAGLRCAEHDLPFHLDKPPGESLAPFCKLLAICRKKKLPMQMGYMYRGNPAFNFSREVIQKGYLGHIFSMEADMNHNYGGDTYQAYIARFSGGIMFNLGCHLLDFAVSVLGSPKTVTSFLDSTPDVPPESKNNCCAVLTYPHATVIVRSCSKNPRGNERRMKITGTGGFIEFSPLEVFGETDFTLTMGLNQAHDQYDAGIHTVNFGKIRDRYESQLREFAGLIRGEMKSAYSFEYEFLLHKVILAASGYDSWENLKDIPFPEV